MMKFAHMGDCHIGAWRDQKLSDAAIKAFVKAVDKCIDENVDFVLISGDLFNTSLPGIDNLKMVVKKLKLLKDRNIPVYTIAGSHDFSPSGKTMLEVLEKAALVINVFKAEITDKRVLLSFTVDQKTGAKITGIIGKKGMLDKKYYEDLVKDNLEQEPGFKIFMLHTAIDEFKPRELERINSAPLNFLPRNFSYYAAGHVHYRFERTQQGYGTIVYPGPLFPTNFREIEDLGHGSFCIVDVDDSRNIRITHEPVKVYNVLCIKMNCDRKNPMQIEEMLKERIKTSEFFNTIVTIRLFGTLETGKPSDINFRDIFSMFYKKGAYFVMKSATMLSSREFEETDVEEKPGEDVEHDIIKEHLGQIKIPGMTAGKEEELTKKLIQLLDKEKEEGELVKEFESRISDETSKLFDI